MFERIQKNSNVWKDKKRTLIFKRMGEKFQCLKGEEKNYILWMNKIRILVFRRIRQEF